MTSASQIPRIGIGVFILNDKNEFIFGKRKGSHGQGTWALPGGHLELHESFEDCARREIQEETGLVIEKIEYLTATNSPRIDGSKHYVTVFVTAKLSVPGSQPELLEPNKCEGWKWVSWHTMMEWYKAMTAEHGDGNSPMTVENKLFAPMIDLVEQRPGVQPL